MIKHIICWFLGHKQWQWNVGPHSLMYFTQAFSIGNESYSINICERCSSLIASKVVK